MASAGVDVPVVVASRRSMVGHAAVHAAMLAAMVGAMLPPGGALRHLGAGLALFGLSLAVAPLARRSRAALDAIVDLWATAAVLLAPVLSPSSAPAVGGHQHGGAPAHLAILAVVACWAAVRVRPGSPRSRLGVLLTGAELGVMTIVELAVP